MNTIQGTVTHILPTQSGMSQKGEWHKSGFVIETQDKFPKRIAFTTWSLPVMNEVKIGNVIKVDFDVESREYNGKWFTDATARKVEAIGKATPEKPKPVQQKPAEMEWPDTSGLKPKADMPEVDLSDLPF